MTGNSVQDLIQKVNLLSDSERAEFMRRLNEKPRESNGKSREKKGYVSPDTVWMRDHSHKYRGMYVAIKNGEFIAAAPTIKEADLIVRSKGIERPLLAYVPREDEVLWGGW